MLTKLFILATLSTVALLPFADQESEENCKQMVMVDGVPDHCVSEFPGVFPGVAAGDTKQ